MRDAPSEPAERIVGLFILKVKRASYPRGGGIAFTRIASPLPGGLSALRIRRRTPITHRSPAVRRAWEGRWWSFRTLPPFASQPAWHCARRPHPLEPNVTAFQGMFAFDPEESSLCQTRVGKARTCPRVPTAAVRVGTAREERAFGHPCCGRFGGVTLELCRCCRAAT
jgi:hypothetical protein